MITEKIYNKAEHILELYEEEQLILHNVTKRSKLLSFIQEVANYNQPHHSRELKLKARELEKLYCW